MSPPAAPQGGPAVSGRAAGRGVRQEFAGRSLYRVLSVSLAVGTLLEFVGTASAVTAQLSLLTVPFTILAIIVIGLPAVVALALVSWAPRPALRVCWSVQAIGMLCIYVGIGWVVGPDGLTTQSQLTWLTELSVVAAVAAALAWRARWAVAYAVALGLVLLGLALYSGDRGLAGMAMSTAVRQVFFIAMFLTLAGALLAAGRALDRTMAKGLARVREQAERDASRSSRRTIGMLVHDSIIVALLAYAGGADDEQAARQAKGALRAIDQGVSGTAGTLNLLPRDVAWELQALTTNLASDALFDYRADGDIPLPQQVVSALTEATSEALRNSIRHAPADRVVSREVHALIGSGEAQVLILDDGVGFDPEHIPSVRLGVRHGIVGRMAAIPGGRARVGSRVGYGTSIVLEWRRP